ncbi:hypothetical protein SAMD00019534_071220 [Acytostelium subglobosum LB1]|uniref:hypothetical protein n=1 Tax=Acytostelium subglobosum LB1 TaxID=1410327 RepID=UPI000644BD7B|nr:hypothetical protein SAMD00019534_071220 [Acytostelium subglobosum LB1]GAM23947.1 hypothetical protein SAMD00019534_071220 [Acytostelium subglobosum LB1]|eukprot:XP_012752983.1 hypothetical protein SAMD00019534_071220 [Acytostelium subglobosum LB1]
MNLRNLVFGDYFNQSLQKIDLGSLTHLSLGRFYERTLADIPPSVTSLTLHRIRDHQAIPGHIIHLQLTGEYSINPDPDEQPQAITLPRVDNVLESITLFIKVRLHDCPKLPVIKLLLSSCPNTKNIHAELGTPFIYQFETLHIRRTTQQQAWCKVQHIYCGQRENVLLHYYDINDYQKGKYNIKKKKKTGGNMRIGYTDVDSRVGDGGQWSHKMMDFIFRKSDK